MSSFPPAVPMSSQSTTRTLTPILPPPTAYRDEPYESKSIYYRSPETEYGSTSDMIEIKRPDTVYLVYKESESGLTSSFSSLLHGECGSSSNGNKHYDQFRKGKARMRSGLFELPEVYNPPPLRPLTPRHKLTLPSPRSSKFYRESERIMPSFVENNLIRSSVVRQLRCSPRLAHSEPILKSSAGTWRVEDVQSPRPETGVKCNQIKTLPPPVSQDTEIATTGNQQGETREQNNNKSHSHSSTFRSDMKRSPAGVYSARRYEHKSEGFGNSGAKPEVEGIVGAAGDNNCCSPSTRLNSHLQPSVSVITPAMAQSIVNECVSNLKSPNWEDNFEAFSQIHSLTEIHPSRVKDALNKIIWQGLCHLSSPRTKLARMSCICFKRLFQTQRRSMEIEGEKVFYKLLDLCGAMSNSFIQQECKEALIAAVESMDPLKSITFLELHGAKHKNPHVREFASYLLNAIMDELPTSRLMNKEFAPRIIPMIVSFLKEGLLQTRLNAKLALDKIFDHSTFESKLRRYVAPENVRHIADTLREFRERRSGHI